MTGTTSLDEPRIVPGQRIGPFRLGEPGEPQVALLTGAREVELRGAMQVIKTREVSLFVEDGIVTQVGIHGEHPAATREGLRLGMTLGELQGELWLDPVDEVLLLADVDGLCFSTDEELERVAEAALIDEAPAVLSRASPIAWIGVHLLEFDRSRVVSVRLE